MIELSHQRFDQGLKEHFRDGFEEGEYRLCEVLHVDLGGGAVGIVVGYFEVVGSHRHHR